MAAFLSLTLVCSLYVCVCVFRAFNITFLLHQFVLRFTQSRVQMWKSSFIVFNSRCACASRIILTTWHTPGNKVNHHFWLACAFISIRSIHSCLFFNRSISVGFFFLYLRWHLVTNERKNYRKYHRARETPTHLHRNFPPAFHRKRKKYMSASDDWWLSVNCHQAKNSIKTQAHHPRTMEKRLLLFEFCTAPI